MSLRRCLESLPVYAYSDAGAVLDVRRNGDAVGAPLGPFQRVLKNHCKALGREVEIRGDVQANAEMGVTVAVTTRVAWRDVAMIGCAMAMRGGMDNELATTAERPEMAKITEHDVAVTLLRLLPVAATLDELPCVVRTRWTR